MKAASTSAEQQMKQVCLEQLQPCIELTLMTSMVPHITGMQKESNTLKEWLCLGIKDAMSVGHKADSEHLDMFDFEVNLQMLHA